jgi:hypothetical protein
MLTAQNHDCLMWPVAAHSKHLEDTEQIEQSGSNRYNHSSNNLPELQARYAAGKCSLAMNQHRLIVSRTELSARRFMAQS